ncbi:MAG: (d)CMP kinase [Candidatus Obscuribacterales bacterium]
MVISEDQIRNRNAAAGVSKTLQIAIDGPAGAGKSTVAKKIADALHYLYIDTGAMYRAATWLVVQKGISFDDRDAIVKAVAESKIELKPGHDEEKILVFVNGEEVTKLIRSQNITKLVSKLAAIGAVREQLVNQQRHLAMAGGVVLDGRDIGTVVLPDANIKIFLTASPAVRAQRRLLELQAAGENPDYDTLLKDIIERDQMDTNREIAPLRMADDAVAILSDKMTVDEVVAHIIKLCS